MIILQYLYAFALFGGLFFGLWKLLALSVRFVKHSWDVSRRFNDRDSRGGY